MWRALQCATILHSGTSQINSLSTMFAKRKNDFVFGHRANTRSGTLYSEFWAQGRIYPRQRQPHDAIIVPPRQLAIHRAKQKQQQTNSKVFSFRQLVTRSERIPITWSPRHRAPNTKQICDSFSPNLQNTIGDILVQRHQHNSQKQNRDDFALGNNT